MDDVFAEDDYLSNNPKEISTILNVDKVEEISSETNVPKLNETSTQLTTQASRDIEKENEESQSHISSMITQVQQQKEEEDNESVDE